MNDLIALFLADLKRAMDGLRQGIAQGPDGMTQASLHARDLSDALQSVSLPRHAEIALVISRHLAAGRGRNGWSDHAALAKSLLGDDASAIIGAILGAADPLA